jgi:hypothetical protein
MEHSVLRRGIEGSGEHCVVDFICISSEPFMKIVTSRIATKAV